MYRIGLEISGVRSNGGSYQYWLTMVTALSQFDKDKYDIVVYSDTNEWCEIADRLGLEFVKLKTELGWVNRRVVNNYRAYYDKVLIGRLIAHLYRVIDCNIKLVARRKPDYWISQYVQGIPDILNIPAMIPIFDLMHRYESHYEEVSSEYYMRERTYKFACLKAKVILADSSVGKKHIEESYFEQCSRSAVNVGVLPFIPPSYILNAQKECNCDLQVFDKFIFYPAQFWKHKNHERLICAISRLREEGYDIKAVFVGSAQNNMEYLKGLLKEKQLTDAVLILDYVTDEELVYLYTHARALVMPTMFGPTNIPPLEAFVLKCPVATSNIYGIPEQVGDAAMLFDPYSIDEIAECVKKLWIDDNLCHKLISKGSIRANEYTQEKFLQNMQEIVENYLL